MPEPMRQKASVLRPSVLALAGVIGWLSGLAGGWIEPSTGARLWAQSAETATSEGPAPEEGAAPASPTEPAAGNGDRPAGDANSDEPVAQPKEEVPPADSAEAGTATSADPNPATDTPPSSPNPPQVDRMTEPSGTNWPPRLPVSPGERQPRILYAPGEDGRLVPILNVPWARIHELLDAQDGEAVGSDPPPFQISQVLVQGQVAEKQAELSVELRIAMAALTTANEPIWTSVPLGFVEGSLLAAPEHQGEGQIFVAFDPQEGYRVWMRHPGGGEHRLTCRLAVPLESTATEKRLRFTPAPAVQSLLELDIPEAPITSQIENGRNLVVRAIGDSQSHVSAVDLRGQVGLTWRKGQVEQSERATSWDVRGDIRVTLDGPSTVRSQVVLNLESYGQPIEQFLLRLPPQTHLVPPHQPGIVVREVTPAPATDGATDDRTLVEITLQNPSAQIRVPLTTQTTVDENSSRAINIASYDVQGAIRQSGQVTLFSTEDWLVYWTLGPGVRRIANAENAAGDGDRQALATFQYFRQPCRLDLEINAQEARVGVRPSYRMHVTEDRVSLDLQLDYKLRGARSSFLNLNLHGWILDDLGPSGAVENDDLKSIESSGVVRMRLTKPTSGDVTLTAKLHRPLAAPAGSLRFALPWPEVDSTTPGTLFVSSADALVLNYRETEMPGFVVDAQMPSDLPPLLTPTDGPRPTLEEPSLARGTTFRLLGDRPSGEFVMDYQVRDQEIRVRADSELAFSADHVAVVQQWTYQVLYRPTNQLTLDIPRPLFDLLTNPRSHHLLELRLDGQMVRREVIDNAAETADSLRPIIPLHLPLDRPRLGEVTVVLRYPWQLRTAVSGEPHSIPLATPRDGRMLSNTAVLSAASTLRIDPSGDATWSRVEEVATPAISSNIQLTTATRNNSLRVDIRAGQDPSGAATASDTTVIQRAWLQTWMTQPRQQDRLVLRVVTGAEQVRLRVPESVRQVDALVGGQRVKPQGTPPELSIPLPESATSETTVEVFLTHANRPEVGRTTVQVPRVVDAVGPRRWFWQLILPEQEHLWAVRAPLSATHRWTLDGWLWRRQTSQSQAHLEEWTEAVPQPEIPSSANVYLYSSFAAWEPIPLETCSRRTLVYSCSAIALTVGWLWTYLPRVRQPVVIFLVGVAFVVLAGLYSDRLWLIIQASLLGIGLSMLAGALAWSFRAASPSAGPRGLPPRGPEGRGSHLSSRRDGSGPHTTITIPPTPPTAAIADSKS